MRKSYVIAFIILVLAGAWMAPAILDKTSPTDEKPQAQETTTAQTKSKEKKRMRVQVETRTAESMQGRIEVNGQTHASRVVDISARTAGRFSKILVERGALVQKGDVIAQMDVEDRQAKLDRARAVLKQRTTEYEVSQGLKAKGYNSQVKLETARANLQIAKADVQQAKLDMSYIKIKAPFTGVLEDRKVEVGTYLGVGDPVATLVDLNPMDVRAFVSEQHIAHLSVGDEADVILPSGVTYRGKVFYIATTANTETRTFRVDIRIENPDRKINSGLTAKVKFILSAQQAHKIPLSAMGLNDAGIVGIKTVIQDAETQDWVASFVPVEILQEDVRNVWVDGLGESVRIIVVGHEFVVDGETVEIAEEGVDTNTTSEEISEDTDEGVLDPVQEIEADIMDDATPTTEDDIDADKETDAGKGTDTE